MEQWKPIEGFLGYLISNLGRIKTPNRISKAKPGKDGYIRITLRKDKKQFTRLLAQLVCEAFNGPKPFPEAMALHKDDVGSHNIWTNLYWGNARSNALDRIANGNQYRHGSRKVWLES